MSLAMPLLTSLVFIFVISSCTPSSPQTRIQNRPQDFQQLSDQHKELVRRGEIAKGMSKAAVALSWGSPTEHIEGFRNGKFSERWNYNGERAVVQHNYHGGFFRGHGGPYSPYSYPRYRGGFGPDFGPDVTYIPYRKASVWFVEDRVNEWERRK